MSRRRRRRKKRRKKKRRRKKRRRRKSRTAGGVGKAGRIFALARVWQAITGRGDSFTGLKPENAPEAIVERN
jgi:hypothetical protein